MIVGASALLGIHGSGLTHCLHLPSHGKCLEIPVEPGYRYFSDLAKLAGISHHFVGSSSYDKCKGRGCFYSADVIAEDPSAICKQVVHHVLRSQ
jgi:hypothetical protein